MFFFRSAKIEASWPDEVNMPANSINIGETVNSDYVDNEREVFIVKSEENLVDTANY